jgi:DNA-binding PadR family transcriptional regulator
MMSRVELSTTAYGILGLLALRPWTTYELARQVQRSLGNLWGVAERQLYDIPKALVADGLATARKDAVGRRPRTTYRITTKGRRALERWLADADEAGFAVRSETLLKAFFAEQARSPKEALLHQIAALREAVVAVPDAHVAMYEATRDEGFPFPERRHVSALVARCGFDVAEAAARWADWATAVVSTWDDDLSLPPDADALLERVYQPMGSRDVSQTAGSPLA